MSIPKIAYIRKITNMTRINRFQGHRQTHLIDGQHYNGEHDSAKFLIKKASILFYQRTFEDSANLVYDIKLDAVLSIWM